MTRNLPRGENSADKRSFTGREETMAPVRVDWMVRREGEERLLAKRSPSLLKRSGSVAWACVSLARFANK